MPYIVSEWINLGLRWFHVFAGIMWIGQTYFFTWLDRTLHAEGNVWMVHSGGFYIVDKQTTPQILPKTLHWFKWEAALTWLSGVLLFMFVYWHGKLMVDETSKLTNAQGVLVSAAAIVVAWFVYDLLMISPLGKNDVASTVVLYILLVAAIYGYSRVFTGRAAYMQTGAMLGTLMAWNVWARILPAQRQLIGAVKNGGAADMRLAEIAKKRSKQNTFMVLPVVFIMLSNHFPVSTYGSANNWLVLAGLVILGWIAAAIIRTR